jgi:hypothetical protein
MGAKLRSVAARLLPLRYSLHLRAVFAAPRSVCRAIERATHEIFLSSIMRGEWISEPIADVLEEISILMEMKNKMDAEHGQVVSLLRRRG